MKLSVGNSALSGLKSVKLKFHKPSKAETNIPSTENIDTPTNMSAMDSGSPCEDKPDMAKVHKAKLPPSAK